MKKVLIFSTAYLPLIGGAEVAVKEITNRLGGDFSAQGGPAPGWEFDFICARIKKELSKQEKVGQVTVYRVGWGWGKIDKLLLPWRGAALATKLHAKQPYTLVWAVMASFGGFAAMFFKKKNPTAPFLLTLQEGDPLDYIKKRVGIFSGWFKQIFTRADHIQAISRFLAEWAKDMGAKCPVDVVPNGVDINKFQPPQINKQDLRSRLGIIAQEKVIITVSRLVNKNGIGDLIEAVGRLTVSSKQLTVKLLVLGTGPLEENLKREVDDLKLKNKVLFLGNIPNEQVPQYLAIADVFVRPSLSEGLGNVFLEAMAVGVPIIGTRVGGIPDFLRDGETGLFCETNNPQSIADKINILFSNEALRQKLIVNGRKLVEEKYDWDKIAVWMRSIFDSLTI